MVNPRRASHGGAAVSPDNQFQTQSFSLSSSLLPLLKKPQAFPLLLAIFLLLTWITLRIEHPSSRLSSVESRDTAQRWSRESDLKVNLVRFLPSQLAKDKRGWLLNPVIAAAEAGITGGAVNCVAVHVGEIRPGGMRGNHRHHACNETFIIWGARIKFRLENNQAGDKGYGEVTVNENEIAVAASPSGSAHALVNVDPVRTAYLLGCQDSIMNTNIKMGGHKKTALLVGCNYPKTEYELRGCINDVISMQETLKGRFGFDPNHIELLTDAPGSKAMPTGANIKAALSRHIEQAEPGDLVFFHYSGHGTWFPSKHHDHHHKRGEAIVPCDFNLITDVDFRAFVNKLSKEATFTFISDSCHSGGLIDKEKEQIGPDSKTSPLHHNHHYQSKYIPIESILSHLSAHSGIISEDAGSHLVSCFKDNASLKFHSSDAAHDASEAVHSESVILLSGCQANETSADMPGQGGSNVQPHGAFSDAVQRVLKGRAGPVTNKELVLKARAVLRGEGVDDQHPCLYCSDADVDAPFLLELRPKDV